MDAAETGFKLASDPDTVRDEELAFVNKTHLTEVGGIECYWPGAPDLAVEVISPSDPCTEVEEKVAEYLQAGAKAV